MTGFDYGMKGECRECIHYRNHGECQIMIDDFKKRGWSDKEIDEEGDVSVHGVDTCGHFSADMH